MIEGYKKLEIDEQLWNGFIILFLSLALESTRLHHGLHSLDVNRKPYACGPVKHIEGLDTKVPEARHPAASVCGFLVALGIWPIG